MALLQDDLRVLLLDSEDPFVRELAEINHLPEDHSHHQQRRGSSSNSSQTQSVPALSGVGFPPTTPPVGEQSQNQRRSSFSQGRMSRRGSERGCGLANATTVSNLFRRHVLLQASNFVRHVVHSKMRVYFVFAAPSVSDVQTSCSYPEGGWRLD